MIKKQPTQKHSHVEPIVRIPDLDVTTEAGRFVRGGVPRLPDGGT